MNEPVRLCPHFVREGAFVVMPLVFPSACHPIDPDASYLRRVAPALEGLCVLGLTGGRGVHAVVAAPKPPQGYVIDLGVLEGAEEPVAILAEREEGTTVTALALANGKDGGGIARFSFSLRHDGIQEWSFRAGEYETVLHLPGRRLRDAVHCGDAGTLLRLDDGLLLVSGAGEIVAETRDHGAAAAPFAALRRLGDGEVLLAGAGGAVHCLTVEPGAIRDAGPLLSLPFGEDGWGWAGDDVSLLAAASADGTLWRIGAKAGRCEKGGRVPVPPVRCLAALPDGRAYGFAGRDFGRFFRFDLHDGTVTDLGAVAAVHGAKRYAYEMAHAVAGPQGEIYCAEDDRGGCLWIYYPPLFRHA